MTFKITDNQYGLLS